MKAESWRLAALSLVRNLRRSTLISTALASAACGGLLFYGFTRHTYWGLSESFSRAGNGHLQIAASAWFDAPDPESHRVAAAPLRLLLQELQADPELAPLWEAATLHRQLSGMLSAKGKTAVFVGTGTDPEQEKLLSPLTLPIAGGPLDAKEPNGVVLGAPLAARLGVQPGDLVTALVMTDSGMTNAMDLKVLGLSRTGAEELDRAWLVMPLETALQLLDTEQVDLLVVGLKQTSSTDAALARVQAKLSPGLSVQPWYQRATYYRAVRAIYDRIFGVFQFLIAMVSLLSLTQAVAALIEQRRQEIALLRVLGIRRREVAWIFAIEGLLLGAAGALGGGLLANAVAWLTELAGGIPMPPPPGFTVGYSALFVFDSAGYAVVGLSTLLASFLAAGLPAWRQTSASMMRVSVVLLGILVPAAASAAESRGELLLSRADAERRVPAGTSCWLDLTVQEGSNRNDWRVLAQEDRAVLVSRSLPAGRRQAVLQEPAATWFQTEHMAAPIQVNPNQRMWGAVAAADLLQPQLSREWVVTSTSPGPVERVQATGRAGRAEFMFEQERLTMARYYSLSESLLRTVAWEREQGELRNIRIEDALQPGRPVAVVLGPRFCSKGQPPLEAATLLPTALQILEYTR